MLGGDSTVVARYSVEAFPTTLVIRGGRILYRNVGYQEGVLREQLASLVASGRPPGRTAPRAAAAVGARKATK